LSLQCLFLRMLSPRRTLGCDSVTRFSLLVQAPMFCRTFHLGFLGVSSSGTPMAMFPFFFFSQFFVDPRFLFFCPPCLFFDIFRCDGFDLPAIMRKMSTFGTALSETAREDFHSAVVSRSLSRISGIDLLDLLAGCFFPHPFSCRGPPRQATVPAMQGRLLRRLFAVPHTLFFFSPTLFWEAPPLPSLRFCQSCLVLTMITSVFPISLFLIVWCFPLTAPPFDFIVFFPTGI